MSAREKQRVALKYVITFINCYPQTFIYDSLYMNWKHLPLFLFKFKLRSNVKISYKTCPFRS